MSEYEKLLKSHEWQIKRDSIVKRDKYCCRKCHNESLKDFRHCEAISTYVGERDITFILLAILDGMKGVTIKRERLEPDVSAMQYAIVYYEQMNARCFPIALRSLDEREIIWKGNIPAVRNPIQSGDELLKWRWNGTLHVHHKYYKLGLKPWEYPDEALISLCWQCHMKLHEFELVPVFNADDILVTSYHPCLRCFGAGYFPEYKHIENGICFRCQGVKYEELIE